MIINTDMPLLTDEDVQRLKDLNVAVFNIPGTNIALEVAGTELSTNMTMIGSVAGITKCVSLEALDGALQERFWEEICGFWWYGHARRGDQEKICQERNVVEEKFRYRGSGPMKLPENGLRKTKWNCWLEQPRNIRTIKEPDRCIMLPL